jgi:DNA-binding winged helix-turn-helix (wHTH) protein/WD40 repeat protein
MATTIERVAEAGARFWLHDWLVAPSLNRISRAGTMVQLESKAMDVLVYLVGRAGEVATHAELQDAVWQTEFVAYNTVANRVKELRDALEDDARNPRYIETITKRGYRLIASVRFGEVVAPDAGALAATEHERPDERSPYPGLEPFSEEDAEDFFGREGEIAALWRKIAGRRLLAVLGPSGAGKSSLLRAGVVARAPPGWRGLVCQPGEAPVLELAKALAPEFTESAGEVQELLRFQDPDVALAMVSRWRGRWEQALIVVDQFEEVFTLSTPSVQNEYVALLRRLVDAAGIHLVLVLRDDFLIECHRFPELEPILKDLTLVGPPVGAALRRALTEPAARRRHAFETEVLVDEMVGEVEAERAALPLLAFAASRMWELRDRDRRLLTREAYEKIGCVGGALAQHAEATLESIGEERLPVVRELLRNLVTAQGTRAVRDRDELLSVFADSRRNSASEVLRALVDARLLTSFEDAASGEGKGGRHHRVEIVHESLLVNWPRLVRWQAQDSEGVLLRDQLRQAAHLWQEKGRPDDLLWTGTSCQEFQLWRSRYPGALSELEETFARAMVELVGRRRRRRQVAMTAAIVGLVAVAAALSLLWRRSVQETRRAEAAKLLALAQARLADDPTEALALTTASLEVADTREAREFVMRALWTAPPAFELDMAEQQELVVPSFSPDGGHVAVAGIGPDVKVWSEDGQRQTRLGGQTIGTAGTNTGIWAAEDLLVTGRKNDVGGPEFDDHVQVWSIPEGKLLRVVPFGAPARWQVGRGRLFAKVEQGNGSDRRIELSSWRLPDGPQELVDSLSATELGGVSDLVAAPDGSGWVVARGREVFFRPFDRGGRESLLEVLDGDASIESFGEDGVLVSDKPGSARLWSFSSGEPTRVWAIRRPTGVASALPDPAGRRLASLGPNLQSVLEWALDGLPGARPLELRRGGSWYDPGFACHLDGDWCAATTQNHQRLTFWPLARTYPSVIEAYEFPQYRREIAFSPDSRWLATGWKGDGIRLLPVAGGGPDAAREFRLPESPGFCADIRFDPSGRHLLVASAGATWLAPLDGEPCRVLVPDVADQQRESGAISPSGARVATASLFGESASFLYLVDVESRVIQTFALPRPESPTGWAEGVVSLEFLDEQTLLTAGWGGVRRWDLAAGTQELVVASAGVMGMRASRAAGLAVTWGVWRSGATRGLELLDLAAGTSRPLEGFGDDVELADLDPSGSVLATGDTDGSIRVGRLDGGEPHLLLGHDSNVDAVAISPDLRWLASSADDGTLRLWPMPDLSKPPLHTLPHDELIAKLHSLTNLRAVRDPASDTGWTIELGPFPGWREIPTW